MPVPNKNLKTGDKIIWVPWGNIDMKYTGVLGDYDEPSDTWHVIWDDGYNADVHEYWHADEIYPLDTVKEYF